MNENLDVGAFDPNNVQMLLSKHGLPSANLVRCQKEGVANAVWYAGEVVVRISKTKEYESDSYTEWVAAPAAFLANCRTPELLVFDDDRDIVDAPVTIFERALGVPLSALEALENPEDFYRELGAEIRAIHDAVRDVPDPNGYLDPAWLIEEKSFSPPEVLVFVHQDLHPDNILVHNDRLSAIIDWGDAGWGDPAVDMRYIPAQYLAAILSGYGSIDEAFERRVWHHILNQHDYCQQNGRSYGKYGDSTKDAIASLTARLNSNQT